MKKDVILFDSYLNGYVINYFDFYNVLREKRICVVGFDVRDVNWIYLFKINLFVFNNCYYFLFKECNYIWDMCSVVLELVVWVVVFVLWFGRNLE